MAFTIHALPAKDKVNSKIQSPLPEGSCLWVAPSNSGKTTTIVNLLLRKRAGYRDEFQQIIIMSPTVYADDSWEHVLADPEFGSLFHVVDRYDEAYLTTLLADQRQAMTERQYYEDNKKEWQSASRGKRRRPVPPKAGKVLLVLDDVANELPSSSQATGILPELFFRGRHAKVFCWISSQSYKRVPRGIRLNSPAFVIFARVSRNEARVISDELSVDVQIAPLLERMADIPHSFLFIDQRSTPRLWHNFERPIFERAI